MIDIKNKKDCCGCHACGDVCHAQAITFHTDHEGFWYPEVDKEKCTDCHLCEKICPMINIDKLKHNDLAEPKVLVVITRILLFALIVHLVVSLLFLHKPCISRRDMLVVPSIQMT